MPVRSADILKLEVPVIVRLGERLMPTSEVLTLSAGAIIELPISSEAELQLFVNNRQVGTGTAVKIGENFGIRVTSLGSKRERLEAAVPDNAELSSLADQFLAGQV